MSTLFFLRAGLLTALILATVLAEVKPWGRSGATGLQESTVMSFAVVSDLKPHTRLTELEESVMTATYTFDVFPASMASAPKAVATGAATGASRALSCSITASPYTASRSGWSSAPTRIGNS